MKQQGLPLSLTQLDIYVDQVHQPQNPLYNIGGYIELEQIDTERMQRAHAHLIKTEPVFRLQFGGSLDMPSQTIQSQSDSHLTLLDFSEQVDPTHAAQSWVKDRMQRPFDLESGECLYDACLIKLNHDSFWYVGIAHHLIMDGWGFSNWASRISSYYNDPETVFSEFDWCEHIEKEYEYSNSSNFTKDKCYWSEVFRDLPDLLCPPRYKHKFERDKPIPGGRATLDVESEDYLALKRLANDWGVNLVNLLLALTTSYLYKIHGNDEFLIGTLSHNRRGKKQKSALGVFTGVTPLRVKLNGDETIRQLASSLASSVKDNFRHQRFPLGQMRKLHNKALSNSLLVDVYFNYLELDQSLQFDGKPAQLNYSSNGYEAIPLKFIVWADKERQRFSFQLDYNQAYFNAQEAQVICSRLQFLIKHLTENSQKPLKEIQILPVQEVRHLLGLAQGEQVEHSLADYSILERLEHQVSVTPERIAIATNDEKLTYRELYGRVNKAAERLLLAGVNPGYTLGVMFSRGAQLVETLLAIFKVGANYVGLDPNYPLSRLKYIVADSGLVAVISDETWTHIAANLDTNIWSLNKQWDPVDKLNEATVSVDKELAYVIYTSGSTGLPKGVEITHSSLQILLDWASETYSAEELSSVLFSTSLNFDLSSFEIFVPLVNGGTCTIVDSILTLLDKKVDTSLINTVPSAMKVLLEQEAVPASVKVVNLAGESLPKNIVNQLLESSSCKRVFNLYGPSEDTTYSTAAEFSAEIDTHPHIGRPLPQTGCYVLSPRRELVAVGEVGELFLGGKGLARGYRGQSELTKARFIQNHIAPEFSSRLYATGDMVRWRPDGNLDYLGRNDAQIKLRGFRIELGEIEAKILQDRRISLCKVILDEKGTRKRLVAFFTQFDNLSEQLSEHELKQELLVVMPEYMVPELIIKLEQMPLTHNGKIDTSMLRDMKIEVEGENESEDCSTLELALSNICQEVLELDSIGVDRNLFEIADSLAIVRLLHAINKRLNFNISLQTLFSAPTVRSLARTMADQKSSSDSWQVKPHRKRARYPLTPIQHRIWLAQKMNPGSNQNVLGGYVDIRGQFDVSKAQNTVSQLLGLYPELNIRIFEVGAEPMQSVEKIAEKDVFEYRDLSQSAASQIDIDLSELETELLSQVASDWSHCLWRVVVVRMANNFYRLFVGMHHIIADGWSMARFVSLFSSCYQGIEERTEVAAERLSFLDYVQWQLSLKLDPIYQQQSQFWQQYLSDTVPAPRLPVHSPLAAASQCNEKDALLISDSEFTELAGAFLKQNSSVFHVIYCALCLSLHRLTGQQDIIINVPVSGRHIPATDEMLGVFLNMLPVRSKVDRELSFADFYAESIDNIETVMSNQEFPIDAILSQKGELQGGPLFNVVLNMLNLPPIDLELPNTRITKFSELNIDSKFDLTLYVKPKGQAFEVKYVFNPKKVDPTTVNTLHRLLRLTLLTMVNSPSANLAEQSSQPNRLHGHGVKRSSTSNYNVCDLIQVGAIRRPNDVACIDSSGVLKYSELWLKVERTAAFLTARGVGQGDIVAIYANRSTSLVISVLATLKLGAVFVILPESDPLLRTQTKLSLCSPKLVVFLTQEGEKLSGLVDFCFTADYEFCSYARATKYKYRQAAKNVHLEWDAPAYLAFTSGTTGQAQLVRGRAASLSHFSSWFSKQFSIGPSARFAMLSGLGHDPLHRDIFLPLILGSTICIPDEIDVFCGTEIANWLNESQINVLNITPSMGKLIWQENAVSVSSLKQVFLVGEALSVAISRLIINGAPNSRLISLYGTTEASQALAYHEVIPDQLIHANPHSSIPIGKGIADVEVFTSNQEGNACEVGEYGEIVIVSDCMSLSVKDKFVEHDTCSAERFAYRTGDFGCQNSAGEIIYFGRNDEQVTVRGFRIELSEVASVLLCIEQVKDAVVWFDKNEFRLCAFIVPAYVAQPISTHSLRRAAREHLPNYMIPEKIVFGDAIPLTSNAKVDYQALTLKMKQFEESLFSPPETGIEEQIANMLKGALQLDSVCMNKDLFSLGGNSLLVSSMIAWIDKTFGVNFSFSELIEAESIRDIARLLERKIAANNTDSKSLII